MRGQVLQAQCGRQGAELAVGHVGPHEPTRQRQGVDRGVAEGLVAVARSSAASRNDRSNRTLWPTMTAPWTNSSNEGSTLDTGGAPSTMSSVIPVSNEMRGGTPHPGRPATGTRPRIPHPGTWPPRSRSAPSVVGEPPVVSTSTTAKRHVEQTVPEVEPRPRRAGRLDPRTSGGAAVAGAVRPRAPTSEAHPPGPTRRGADRHEAHRKHEGVR